jgi:hypothetical protein
MNAAFPLALPLDLPPLYGEASTGERLLEAAYREAEAEAELAGEAVRAAAECYRADRNPRTEDAYRAADRRYDAARNGFQLASANYMNAVRARLRAAREAELADASEGRML